MPKVIGNLVSKRIDNLKVLGIVVSCNEESAKVIWADGEVNIISQDIIESNSFNNEGFNHPLSKYEFISDEKLAEDFKAGHFDNIFIKMKGLLEGIELTQSGYAGVTREGTIVDRRKVKDAIPIQKNTMFGVPTPKQL